MMAETVARDLPQDHPLAQEQAAWLPSVSRQAYAWGLFRSEIELSETVGGASLYWSGSQRCTIWLDGVLLADGPMRSDRETWPWVTTPLPELTPGQHCLASKCTKAVIPPVKGRSAVLRSG